MKHFKFIFLFLVFLSSCGLVYETYTKEELEEILDKGVDAMNREISYISEFHSAFPSSSITIANFVDKNPYKRNVQCKGYIYGRYIVYMDLIVEFENEPKFRVVRFSDPRFYVSEVVSIDKTEDNGTVLKFGSSFNFNHKDWEKLYDHQMDFMKIGEELIVNAPVEGFEHYKNSMLQEHQNN